MSLKSILSQSQILKYKLLRQKNVPPITDQIKTHSDFLTIIGRNTISVSEKFKDWNSFYLATPDDMKRMGIKPNLSKYISSWKEWFSRGKLLKSIPVPIRQKKHLGNKIAVKEARMKKLGLA